MDYGSGVATETDLELAVRLAQAAGQLLLQIRQDAGVVAPDDKAALKALRDKADAAAHVLITDGLAEARPADAVLSEEGKDNEERLSARRVWIVDPLDGTWEYGQGRSDFGVHIALYDTETGDMLTGVVDLPEQGLTRTSQDEPALASLPHDRPIRIVASRTRPPQDLQQIADRLANRLGHEVEIVNVGSVGAKVNVILQGDAEAYLHNTGFYEWDLAAPLGVAQQYGLAISHWDQGDVVFNQMPPYVKDVFVSHPALAGDLSAALTGPE
ncbi:MAG: 3'(2'),5'-bisphosphate nucleotidase CysQ [Actinomycetia bacterium]|nr:3'(2'),5'-bisphosphate nucleotidase CysQ [Actinomycetes bacterium]